MKLLQKIFMCALLVMPTSLMAGPIETTHKDRIISVDPGSYKILLQKVGNAPLAQDLIVVTKEGQVLDITQLRPEMKIAFTYKRVYGNKVIYYIEVLSALPEELLLD